MKFTLRSTNGVWYELENWDDFNVAHDLSRTGVGWVSGHELDRRQNGHASQPYLMLVANDGLAHAVVRVASVETENVSNVADGYFTIGFGRTDPYIDHADDIAALGEHYGVDLGPHRMFAAFSGRKATYSLETNSKDGTGWVLGLDHSEQETVKSALTSWSEELYPVLDAEGQAALDTLFEGLERRFLGVKVEGLASKLPIGFAKIAHAGILYGRGEKPGLGRDLGRIGRCLNAIRRLNGLSLYHSAAGEAPVPAPLP